jgi:hypothetical protein
MKNPGRQQYYDPYIEGEEETIEAQVQLRAIGVQEPGTYILFEDIMDAIRSFALSVDSFKKQQGVHELIMWLEGTGAGFAEEEQTQPGRIFPTKESVEVEAERIELYPDADKKWHARLIDHNGLIIGSVNGGSFDREWVETDAASQYPNLTIHQMEEESDDSTWTHKGPSKRLWNK